MLELYERFFAKNAYLAEFQRFLPTVDWSDRSPLNTEMFFLWSMIRSTKPKLFVESGTFMGYSAHFICEAIRLNDNNARFVTYGFNLEDCILFARKRLRNYPFAEVVEGDSRTLIGQLRTKEPVAFFIDGPKGVNMLPLFYEILGTFENIEFLAVHDCEKESGSRNRWYVERFFGLNYATMYCEKEFQTRFGYLDESLIGRSRVSPWRPFKMRGQTTASYGTETGYVIQKFTRGGLFTRAYASMYRSCRFRLYERVARVLGRRNTRT